MMTKDFKDMAEASDFIQSLLDSKKYAVLVDIIETGYRIKWIELKTYVAQDGKEYLDEVWETKEGQMVLIQDLAPEHARNIIRMMIRNEREVRNALKQILAQAAKADEEDSDLPTEDDIELPETGIESNLPNYIHGNKTIH